VKGPAQPGHVYLVGAGPGDPSLLTMRAHELLSTASHVFPDGLISEDVLVLANVTASITPVGKRFGRPRVTQQEINSFIIAAARAGESVVRLKSGDPLVFGRAGEEIEALRAAAIPLEVVPGITAAFAAAASLQIPLTNRTSASKLILATAHYAANKAELDPDPQPVWDGSLPEDATLVLYMPGPDLGALAVELISAGTEPSTPVTTISRISAPDQLTWHGDLGSLQSASCGPAPVLLLIGRALALSKGRQA
jgi:uroporphyrin-III C-methyltransferase